FQVGVSVPQPGRHVYQYEEECTGGGLPGRFTVRASYDVASQEAQEKLVAVSGAWTITSAWSCPADPWIRKDAPGCRNTLGQIDARGEGAPIYYDWARQPKPLSVLLLEDQFYPVLNGQLQNALKQPATPPPAPAPAPAEPILHLRAIWPTVEPGNTGEAVTTIQYLLRHHGIDVSVDGDFGTETALAVARFRGAHGLGSGAVGLRGAPPTADRIVTPDTWRALVVTLSEGSQGDAVAAVQHQLASRGIAIVVDGDFGDLTADAVRQYQQARGLTADGTVTAATWSSLVVGR
ncbi:MAG TPA: peptidoglycan-binding protein, partial [Vicinamibacteria bacterium]|nr:peptidoglycan-binding protein [Vicinamibacteria bacterium]